MQEKLLRVTENTLIVGIDVAKKIHWARMTNSRGVDLAKPFKVTNDTYGFEYLMVRIKNLCYANSFNQVIIGMEPSGHYWKALGWYLFLHESNPKLVGVNPYHTKRAKELDDNSPTKSDKKDALTIGHLADGYGCTGETVAKSLRRCRRPAAGGTIDGSRQTKHRGTGREKQRADQAASFTR